MRVRILSLWAGMSFFGVAAQALELTAGIEGGYRQDQIDWTIIFNTFTGGRSKLEWNDLRIAQVRGHAKLRMDNNVVVKASAAQGWIFDGDNQDDDFRGFTTRPVGLFSRSNNSSEGDDVVDLSAAIGYRFTGRSGGKKVFYVTPFVGYSYHKQDLRMTDGVQTIPPLGPFAGLNSRYRADWKGPWVGVEVSFAATRTLGFDLALEGHYADYEADATWNLRTDFAQPNSFEHDTDGYGLIASAGLNYEPWQVPVIFSARFDWQSWTTNGGRDRTFFADGRVIDGPLEEVNWESIALNLGVSYRF